MFHRNSEGYYDPTAGVALKTIEKGERMDWQTGDVIVATREGSPIEKRFLVLAQDGYVLTGLELFNREVSNCIPVLCGTEMYVNPYRLNYVSFSSNEIKLIRSASEEEMETIKAAVKKALCLDNEDEGQYIRDEAINIAEEQAKELIRANERAAVYKELYEGLLRQMMKATA